MMRSIQQTQHKYDLHNELKIRYREFFESKWAIHLSKQAKEFSSVSKISSAIVKLIESNKKTVINLIANDHKMIAELREPYFGSCYDSKQEVTAEEVFEKILLILKNETPDLSNVMQIHCIFIHRIYDHLEKKSEKPELVSKLYPGYLFSKENRHRVEEKKEKMKLTTQLGISRHRVFNRMLEHASKKHQRAIEKFVPNYQANFFKSALKEAIPVATGPSGHAGSLMLGAKLYGNLTSEEMTEYALACFAFLAAGGHHSYHEVMTVAALVGVDFQVGNYEKGVPSSIKKTKMYQILSKQFPEFLNYSAGEVTCSVVLKKGLSS